MSGRKPNRPRRGPAGRNVLISGDTGLYGGPQGGAEDGATESGDLASREFGVPQADIPGGVRHLVNPPTIVDSPPPKRQRPADYHKEHGVPPDDWGPYEPTPDATEKHGTVTIVPEPKYDDAVPVRVVQEAGKDRKIRVTSAFNINVRAASLTNEPSRICGRDPDRVEIGLLNEDATTDIRICEKLDDLQVASTAGTGAAGQGALIWHGTNSYTWIKTQEQLFAITTSTTLAARLSVIIVTEQAEATGTT